MKKTTLLTSFVALALVLGLGACSNEEDKEPNNDDGSTTSEVVTLSNYTVEFDLGELIPSYAKGYIIGSWDSWGSWLALEETEDGTYTYTFSSINEGTYSYKGVMFYADDNPDWSITNAEFLTDGGENVTLVVSAADNGYQLIEHELENVLTTPLSDDEIVEGIIETASQYSSDCDELVEQLTWAAYYYEDYSDYEGTSVYYLTSDSNELAYGSYIGEDEGEVTYSYFYNGIRYNYYEYETDLDEAFTTQTWEKDYTYAITLQDYYFPFEILGDAFTLDDYEVSLIRGTGAYQLDLKTSHFLSDDVLEIDTYTYLVDTDFNLIGVGYSADDEEDGVTSFYVEDVTSEVVEASMDSFFNDRNAWAEDNDLNSLLTEIYEAGNFELDITYVESHSDHFPSATTTWDEFYKQYEDTITSQNYPLEFYYTENATAAIYYITDDLIPIYYEIYVNDDLNNQMLHYEGEEAASLELTETLAGKWQDNLFTPLELYEYRYLFTEDYTDTNGKDTYYNIELNNQDIVDFIIRALFDDDNWLVRSGIVTGPSMIGSYWLRDGGRSILSETTYSSNGLGWTPGRIPVLQVGFWTGAYTFLLDDYYWWEQDQMWSWIYGNPGQIVIPSVFSSYLN